MLQVHVDMTSLIPLVFGMACSGDVMRVSPADSQASWNLLGLQNRCTIAGTVTVASFMVRGYILALLMNGYKSAQSNVMLLSSS